MLGRGEIRFPSLRRVRDVVVDELAPDGGDDHEVVVRAELVRVDRHRYAPRRRKELQGWR